MSSNIRRWVDVNVEGGEEFLLTSEAAEVIGKSLSTLQRWISTGQFSPSHSVAMKSTTVNLYTPADIDKLHALAADQQVGRPRKEVA